MATPVWKNVFSEVPDTDRTVWIVRLPFFDTPTQADYVSGAQVFEWHDSNGFTVDIPQAQIFKWRDV